MAHVCDGVMVVGRECEPTCALEPVSTVRLLPDVQLMLYAEIDNQYGHETFFGIKTNGPRHGARCLSGGICNEDSNKTNYTPTFGSLSLSLFQ